MVYCGNETEHTDALASRRPSVRTAWFGTSLVEHFEAYNPCLTRQTDLPEIGSLVQITSWRRRGYAHAVMLALMVRYPWITFSTDNFGEGGSTSVGVRAAVETAARTEHWDVVFLGCGINDVWRQHQGRQEEAVTLDDFDTNIRFCLEILTSRARRVIVVGEPPMGWDAEVDAAAVNADLVAYNQRTRTVAAECGAEFIDLWDDVTTAATWLDWSPAVPSQPAEGAPSIWADGVHLSEHGVELVRQTIMHQITSSGLIERLIGAR
ncbi:SGNH/GDSL hydrolase family protein [Nocardia brasiliensis]|uniref:SGNH/GDSL hydrolase family protein n=1 Tax=Nocardia brasiliensis TaxID=37326 RepID=UPI002455306A|nr:SGNH/GDSL hydrolase family protein [Nocardia brasiliensis]